MSFRRRLTLYSAAAVAISIAVAAVVAYLLVRSELRDQIDGSLLERANAATGSVDGAPFGPGRGAPPGSPQPPADLGQDPPGSLRLPDRLGGPEVVAQVVGPAGEVLVRRGLPAGVILPVGPAERLLESGDPGPVFSDASVDGESLRVLTIAPGDEFAIQTARSLAEVESTLSRLALIMALIALAGVGAAAGLGLVVARTALAPVARLSSTAEEVARTEDLSRRIEVEGDDELARLGESFNSMMESLERSVGAQKQLVADASHELRTPLTSLRTNIETLARRPDMPDGDRGRLLADLESELAELGRLVDDIVDLARDGADDSEPSEMRLDRIVAACIERAERRADGVGISAELEPVVIVGRPERLDRAVGNLLDNALKWTPGGGTIAVTLEGTTLTVDDSGSGIPEQERARVFDRFYRSAAARGSPGSGLGLAIVKQVAESHGGSARATESPLGGARMTLTLPGAESPEASVPQR